MRYAIVKDGIVQNIILWDGESEFNVDGELIEATYDAWIGGVYDDGSFVERVPTAEEIALQEEEASKEALRQSMITKLASTLTPEETALLEELL